MARLLFVTDTAPFPATTGSAQRSQLLLRALQADHDVDLLLVARWGLPPVEIADILVREYAVTRICTPWVRNARGPLGRYLFHARALLDRWRMNRGDLHRAYQPDRVVARALYELIRTRDYDLVVGRYVRPTALAHAFAYTPIVLDADDLDTDHWRTLATAPTATTEQRARAMRALETVDRVVPSLLARCAHVWVTSATDRARIVGAPATVLPNVPFTAPAVSATTERASTESRDVLIVASLGYDVNVRAVDQFVTACWPGVVQAHPDARLRIVGTGMTPAMRARWGVVPGVVPVGPVPDVRPEYARCLFSVAPIYEGGGTKIKVVESLAFGRTVVGTRHAIRGYERLRDEDHVWVAEDDAGLRAHCIRLLADPARAVMSGTRGQAEVMAAYTTDRFADIVRTTVRAVLGETVRQGSAHA